MHLSCRKQPIKQTIEGSTRLGLVMTKHLFAQTIPGKIFETKQKNLVKLEKIFSSTFASFLIAIPKI